MEDLRQAVGQDRSTLTLTQRLVVDALDTATAGDVVLRRRELDRPVIGELHRRLHKALTIALDAHDDSAIEILQSTAHDLGGRGRLPIDEHGDGDLRVERLVSRAIDDLLTASITATRRHDLLACGDEEVDDLDGFVDEPTTIVAQVKDEPTELVLGLEVQEGLLHLNGCRIGEAREGDIAHILPDDTIVRHGADLNLLTAELNTARLRLPWTLDEERDLAPWRTLEGGTHLIAGRLTEVLTVDFEDDVTSTQTGLRSGHTLHGVVDDDRAIGALRDDRPDTAISPSRQETELVGILRRIVLGIGVEALEHTVQADTAQTLDIDGVDKVAVKERQ